jgi:chromatin remodeling complex protein RSC6
MTKQSKSSTKAEAKTEKVAPVVSAAVEAVLEDVQKSVNRKRSKTEKAEKSAEKPVETVKEETVKEVVKEEEASSEPKQRRTVNREEVEKSFDGLLASLDEEIENLRKNDDKNKSKGVRFLRSVAKTVRQLRSDPLRLATKKVRRQSSTKSGAGNSGFMKPVKISKDMQKFTGLKEDQLVSRVDVTKSICQYVKTNNLQNEADRRQFTPDAALAKLLGTTTPLTYYALQQHIQPHFIKDAVAAK